MATELTPPESGPRFPMLYSSDRTSKWLQFTVVASFSASLILSPLAFAHDDHDKEKLAAASEKTLTGEIVDLMCYADHGATGEKHAQCAATCIKGGGPVAILSDGKTYLVVGDHKPMNEQLAEVRRQNNHVERQAREQRRNPDARECRDREEVALPSPQRRDFAKHPYAVAREAHLASFEVVPAHGNLLHPQVRLSRQIKQLDVETESVRF